MKYLGYLLLSFLMQLVAWVITPIIPLFSKEQWGFTDNRNSVALGPRLPTWLSWFMTPDNDLYGDTTFRSQNKPTYLSQVKWLYRNSLYGFKWSVLAAPPSSSPVEITGNKLINYKGPVFGTMFCKSDQYWQWKAVKPLFKDYCMILNFGWLIEDGRKEPSLFMFSPRVKRVKYE